MYKKFVRYDRWHFVEVDPVALRRQAQSLKDQIQSKISRDKDPYEFYTRTLPVVEAALRGEIIQPLEKDASQFVSTNFSHDRREGLLPEEFDGSFTKLVADFSVTVRGMPLELLEKIEKDGETWVWVDFEEEGDWPDRVKFP